MRRQGKPAKKRRLLGWILLALLCVTGTELAVCRFADPALFRRLTEPVAALSGRLWSSAAGALAQLPRQISQLAQPEETPEEIPEPEAPVSQLAGEPAIVEDLTPEDPAVTGFRLRDGREILTGGAVDVVYFCQGEEPWASSPYGPDAIRGYGCGPVAMSMVVSSLTPEVVDPAEMARFAYQAGYCAPGSGSYLSIVEGTAAAYGLEAESVPDLSAEQLYQDLASGCLFVALMTKGHFTNAGHFILLRGVTLDGRVLVADPNSRERSLAAWDPELILSELSPSRNNGAPLWRFPALGPAS